MYRYLRRTKWTQLRVPLQPGELLRKVIIIVYIAPPQSYYHMFLLLLRKLLPHVYSLSGTHDAAAVPHLPGRALVRPGGGVQEDQERVR